MRKTSNMMTTRKRLNSPCGHNPQSGLWSSRSSLRPLLRREKVRLVWRSFFPLFFDTLAVWYFSFILILDFWISIDTADFKVVHLTLGWIKLLTGHMHSLGAILLTTGTGIINLWDWKKGYDPALYRIIWFSFLMFYHFRQVIIIGSDSIR